MGGVFVKVAKVKLLANYSSIFLAVLFVFINNRGIVICCKCFFMLKVDAGIIFISLLKFDNHFFAFIRVFSFLSHFHFAIYNPRNFGSVCKQNLRGANSNIKL